MVAQLATLRPESLVEEGLVGALRKQAAALSAYEDVAITVDGPLARLHLDARVEEHLYRIATEALHNVLNMQARGRLPSSSTSSDNLCG